MSSNKEHCCTAPTPPAISGAQYAGPGDYSLQASRTTAGMGALLWPLGSSHVRTTVTPTAMGPEEGGPTTGRHRWGRRGRMLPSRQSHVDGGVGVAATACYWTIAVSVDEKGTGASAG